MIRQTVGWMIVSLVAVLLTALGASMSDDYGYSKEVWSVLCFVAILAFLGGALFLGIDLIQGKGW